MRAVYAKNGALPQHISNKTWRKWSRNMHEYVKGKCTSFAKNVLISLNTMFDKISGKGAFEIQHSFLFVFVGMLFWIIVCKFLVHLRTVYASPQKLERDCWVVQIFLVFHSMSWELMCRWPWRYFTIWNLWLIWTATLQFRVNNPADIITDDPRHGSYISCFKCTLEVLCHKHGTERCKNIMTHISHFLY